MIIGILYPFVYDTCQLYKQGWSYFSDAWNYTDMAFQWTGILNIVFMFEAVNPGENLKAIIAMSMVLFLALVKTMFFMRIFDELSHLVTLIRTCIYDLRHFMTFYVIIVFMFSLILGVLGYQNFTAHDDYEEML